MYPARFSVHQHFADPEQNHQRGMPDWLDPKAPSLPRFLKQAGYRTAHSGKWQLPDVLLDRLDVNKDGLVTEEEAKASFHRR